MCYKAMHSCINGQVPFPTCGSQQSAGWFLNSTYYIIIQGLFLNWIWTHRFLKNHHFILFTIMRKWILRTRGTAWLGLESWKCHDWGPRDALFFKIRKNMHGLGRFDRTLRRIWRQGIAGIIWFRLGQAQGIFTMFPDTCRAICAFITTKA